MAELEPNEALRRLILEANGSWAGLARRVNDLGKAAGMSLNYDYTAVGRWVNKGQVPKGVNAPVPGFIAQALSEQLGRRVTPSDFGMVDDESVAVRGLVYSSDPITTLDTLKDLGMAEMRRRSILAAPFVLAALGTASRDWLLSTFDAMSGNRGNRRVGMREVGKIRDMFGHFQEMDVMRGGGSARTPLVEYMNSYVMPLVREKHEPDVQAALYEAAAEQAYLVGWMAYDDGQHGIAQRWLIQSLQLAQESGNPILGAHVLAGMSDQANLLGYPQEALSLARTGQRGINLTDSPACLADLLVLEARAHASLGDAAAAAHAVARSEETFQHVDHANEPEWARFIDTAYVFGEAAQAFRDLKQPDQVDRFANESAADARRQNRARRGALSEATLAVAELDRGNVESAASKGAQVIRLARSVDSSRCAEAVKDLEKRFQPYAEVAEVQEFSDQARVYFGTAA